MAHFRLNFPLPRTPLSIRFLCATLAPSNKNNLAGTLTHLTALATKTTHALLLPLFAHASGNFQQEVDFLVLLDAVSGEGALRKLRVAADEADEVGGYELPVLHESLQFVNRRGRIHRVGVLADNNLHN